MTEIQRAIQAMQETRLWIDATGGQSIETIAGEAERIRDIESRIDLIVVDYIQIIRGIRNRGDSREQEIASISGGLKQLAKTMNCAVLTGTQLNDDGKTRESRAIEQDSDVLVIIKDAGLEMRKVRNGPRGEVLSLALDGEAQRFRYFASEQ
jgi:replicative DNA helicase